MAIQFRLAVHVLWSHAADWIVKPNGAMPDTKGMARCWIIALFLLLLSGCGGKPGRMEHPEDPQGRYHQQIAVAKELLEQKEQWADRAEWEVLESRNGWEVIAWRVEHPERKGPSRYLPWGYSVIELDRSVVAVRYRRKG